MIERTVLPIHFENRSGHDFEHLAFAYLWNSQKWDSLEWMGQTGNDGGRDIWGAINGVTYCFQCANYRLLAPAKIIEDINKLTAGNFLPDNFVVICGGQVSAKGRELIKDHARKKSISRVEIWSGAEFEERLRTGNPALLKRFVEGSPFPELENSDPVFARVFARIDFAARLQELTKLFLGREWVFHEIDKWLDNPDGRCLIITGNPGSGKSAIASKLIEKFKDFTACHLCVANTSYTQNSIKFIHSMVAQMASISANFRGKILALSGEFESIFKEDALSQFDQFIRNPLAKLDTDLASFLWIIDGVDETDHELQSIADILSKNQAKINNVKVIMTCRNSPRVFVDFPDSHYLNLSDIKWKQDCILDISNYVDNYLMKAKLTTNPAFNEYDVGLKKIILERSSENFLYVVTALSSLRYAETTLAEMNRLPEGLAKLYEDYLDNIFPGEQGRAYFDKKVAPILELICASLEPLDAKELAILLELPDYVEVIRELSKLNTFFIQPFYKYSFFHKSFADWLSSEDALISGKFYVNVLNGHKIFFTNNHLINETSLKVKSVKQYLVRYSVKHYGKLGDYAPDFNFFKQILFSPDYICQKAVECGIYDLIEEFQFIRYSYEIDQTIGQAIDQIIKIFLSNLFVLSQHPDEILTHLYGNLITAENEALIELKKVILPFFPPASLLPISTLSTYESAIHGSFGKNICSLAVSDSTIYTGNLDGVIELWSVNTMKNMGRYSTGSGKIKKLQLAKQNTILCSFGESQYIFWEISDAVNLKQYTKTVLTFTNGRPDLAFKNGIISSDACYMVVSGNDRDYKTIAHIYRVGDGFLLHKIDLTDAFKLKICPASKYLYYIDRDQKLMQFDLTNLYTNQISFEDGYEIACFDLNGTGTKIHAAIEKWRRSKLVEFDLTLNAVTSFLSEDEDIGLIETIISDDTRNLVTYGGRCIQLQCKIWEVDENRADYSFTFQNEYGANSCVPVEYSHNRCWFIATIENDIFWGKTWHLWDVQRERVAYSFSSLGDLKFSLDGYWLFILNRGKNISRISLKYLLSAEQQYVADDINYFEKDEHEKTINLCYSSGMAYNITFDGLVNISLRCGFKNAMTLKYSPDKNWLVSAGWHIDFGLLFDFWKVFIGLVPVKSRGENAEEKFKKAKQILVEKNDIQDIFFDNKCKSIWVLFANYIRQYSIPNLSLIKQLDISIWKNRVYLFLSERNWFVYGSMIENVFCLNIIDACNSSKIYGFESNVPIITLSYHRGSGCLICQTVSSVFAIDLKEFEVSTFIDNVNKIVSVSTFGNIIFMIDETGTLYKLAKNQITEQFKIKEHLIIGIFDNLLIATDSLHVSIYDHVKKIRLSGYSFSVSLTAYQASYELRKVAFADISGHIYFFSIA